MDPGTLLCDFNAPPRQLEDNGQRADRQGLQASDGLKHDPRLQQRLQLRDQPRHARLGVRDPLKYLPRTLRHIELPFGHIRPDKDRRVTHRDLHGKRLRVARPNHDGGLRRRPPSEPLEEVRDDRSFSTVASPRGNRPTTSCFMLTSIIGDHYMTLFSGSRKQSHPHAALPPPPLLIAFWPLPLDPCPPGLEKG